MLHGFLDAKDQSAYYDWSSALACPAGYLVQGYQARADGTGIDYFDVSPPSADYLPA